MKKIATIFYLLLTAVFHQISAQPKSTDSYHVEHMLCEYLTNPIGMDTPNPRLKWNLNDTRQGAFQSAYEIFVGTDSLAVSQGSGNMWQPGQVYSDKMLIIYEGEDLQPFTKYFWAVRFWDKDSVSTSLSETASFETGMMHMANWQGKWITDTKDTKLKPAPYFRNEFSANKEIKEARAYITAAGLFELFINGQRVGDHILDPAYTRFDKRNLYVTHDVTHLITKNNAIGVLLGNGWYNHQSTAVWDFHKALWRARPRFCMNIRITYTDGSTETIASDDSWKTALSPVVLNSIYTAEHYDARLEQSGWNKIGFDDSHWKNSKEVEAPSQNIAAQLMHPIRHIEEITPVSMHKVNSNQYIFDLGRNIAGISRISLKAAKGTELRVTHSELLDAEGKIDQANINLHYQPKNKKDPFQTDIYTLKGEGVEKFYPRFNYKGFQYVEVLSNKPIELDKNSLTGIVMHSDVPPVGKISSSNSTLNKIWEATNASYLANFFAYPTDCPQREKNGWTGDAHIANETGLYNFDGITVYEKWLADHRDEQKPNGVLPAIIPSNGWGYHWANGPDWTSTIAIIPWNIYLFYGDSRLLEDCYDNIKLYVDHITEISNDNLTDWGLGDWIPVKSRSPKELTSSIYYFVDVTILANAAKLVGNEKDYQIYSELARNIKDAINDKYLNKKNGIYGSGYQTELSATLFWGLVPNEYRQKVADNLAKRVIADNKHIDVGLLGSKTILNALSENGYANLAYEVASQETYPSWGYWIVQGNTTLAENWDLEKNKHDASRNHIMFGEISAWYYKALGGIKPDPENPGFKHILLEPHFVEGLEHFEASYKGTYGEIVSSWEKENGKVIYKVVVPPNSSATLKIKATKVAVNVPLEIANNKDDFKLLNLASGTYEFIIEE